MSSAFILFIVSASYKIHKAKEQPLGYH